MLRSCFPFFLQLNAVFYATGTTSNLKLSRKEWSGGSERKMRAVFLMVRIN